MTTLTIDDTKMEKWLPIPKVASNFFLKAHFSNFGGNFHNNFFYFSMDFKEKIFSQKSAINHSRVKFSSGRISDISSHACEEYI